MSEDSPKIVSIKTRRPYDGPQAPPVEADDFIGPIQPEIDRLSLKLVEQVRALIKAGELFGLCVIGVGPDDLPIVTMTTPADFDGALYGVRLLGTKTLEEMIMDELAGVGSCTQYEDYEGD